MRRDALMTMGHPPASLAAVVLAAGRSARMGRPKAFLPAGLGETFLGRILRILRHASAGRLFVVGAPDWSTRRPELITDDATLVVNPDAGRGQLSSLQCGLSAMPPSTGAVVALVDVPYFTIETTVELIETWRRTGADVVRPVSNSRHGHPIVIGQSVIRDLLEADARGTARTVLARHASSTVDVPTSDPGPFTDIDTPEDYERVTGIRL
jgi:molybdenum cofactor cytidylyltransferase